jgi:hypothetical protein
MEHLFHAPDSFHRSIEFREFSLGHFPPQLRDRFAAAQTAKKLPDFIERESDFLCPPHDGEPVVGSASVSALAAHAPSGRQYADLFVVANGGGTQPSPPCDFRYRQ